MKRIKITTLLPLAISCLGCVSCSLDKNAKTYRFNNLSNDFYIYKRYMRLYFPDQCNLPYVDVKSFVKDLNGLFLSDYISFNKDVTNHELSLSLPIAMIMMPTVTFNWENDTIYGDQNFFKYIASQSQTTDYEAHFQNDASKSSVSEALPVLYKLRDYNFDIKYENGKVLIPLVIANMIFCSHNYYNIIFNGEQLYGVFNEVSDQAIINQITTSKLNNTAIPEDIAKATLNSFNFAVDYYYGLKEVKDFSYAKDFFTSENQALLSSTSYKDHLDGINNIIFKEVNDLHSRVDFYSCYAPIGNSSKTLMPVSQRGNRWTEFYQVREQLNNLRGLVISPVRYSGDTAIITFDSFLTGDRVANNKPDSYKYDTFKFFQYVMSDIKNHSEVNDILIDLSLNGGGNIAAMIRALGFITDDNIYYYLTDTLTTSNTKAAFQVDTDGNGAYTGDAYTNYRWTVLSSLNTFSAANLFTSIFQNQNMGKVLGQTSGGGMCVVLPLVLADGTGFTLSGNMTFRKYSNGKLEPIEFGVEPDARLDYQYFYNDDKLVEAIDNLYR